jgi:hypothetical protein
MAMVNEKHLYVHVLSLALTWYAGSTNSAPTALIFQHLVVVVYGDAIQTL